MIQSINSGSTFFSAGTGGLVAGSVPTVIYSMTILNAGLDKSAQVRNASGSGTVYSNQTAPAGSSTLVFGDKGLLFPGGAFLVSDAELSWMVSYSTGAFLAGSQVLTASGVVGRAGMPVRVHCVSYTPSVGFQTINLRSGSTIGGDIVATYATITTNVIGLGNGILFPSGCYVEMAAGTTVIGYSAEALQ